jgi:hypothetical protein
MQLAALQPGVTVTPGSTAQLNTLFDVSILGAGNRTVFTIPGLPLDQGAFHQGAIQVLNLAEVFNAFNLANLTGYNFTLDNLAGVVR